MNRKFRKLTLSALLTALTMVSLFFAAMWPSGELGLAAFSSVFAAAAIIEEGVAAGVSVFVCSAALSLILFPGIPAPLFYISFFGYYPVFKSLIERVKARPVRLLLKLCVFNAALAVMYYSLSALVISFRGYSPGYIVLCVSGSAVFLAFDYGFTKIIRLYEYRIHGRRM